MNVTHSLGPRLGTLLAAAIAVAGCVEPESACPTWGDPPPADWVHVDQANGSPAAAGTIADPVDTVAEGLTLARAAGASTLAIGPGDYADVDVALDAADSGLTIRGCTQAETILRGHVGTSVSGTNILLPVFDVHGGSTGNITISDLTVADSRRAITVRGGAGGVATGAPIQIARVSVQDSVRLGILISGAATQVELADVVVDGVTPDQDDAGDDVAGWGMAVQAAVPLNVTAPPNLATNLTITDTVEVGLVVSGGHLDVLGLTVTDTAPSGGQRGHAVQFQQHSAGLLDSFAFTGSSDAAVSVHQAGRTAALPFELRNGTISGTAPGAAPGDQSPTGDGLVVHQGGGAELVETLVVIVEGVNFTDEERANVINERSLVVFDNPTSTTIAPGTAFPELIRQDGGLYEDENGAPDPFTAITPPAPLNFERGTLTGVSETE